MGPESSLMEMSTCTLRARNCTQAETRICTQEVGDEKFFTSMPLACDCTQTGTRICIQEVGDERFFTSVPLACDCTQTSTRTGL